MSGKLQSHWSRFTFISVLLLPLAGLFALAVRLRCLAYVRGWKASYAVTAPVIVVGNITAGGSGKTPLVIWLVNWLVEQGLRPGVISRGYRGTVQGCEEVRVDSQPAHVGDEPLLIHTKTQVPVVVGRDRVAAARTLLAAHPEINILVSDDGLQHYRLQRQLELAVVDAGMGFGNALPLPAGPLREPKSRLHSVDAVIYVHRSDTVQSASQECYRADYMLSRAYAISSPDVKVAVASLPFEPWLAVTGIGNPQSFLSMLRRVGWVFESKIFPDHHAFQPEDIPRGTPVVMTEKDAVKCASFAQPDWWALELEVQPDDKLIAWLGSRIKSLTR
ncbi:MAG: tetraacyldisaccharide 4'-kinase [Thiobacillus sp.]